MDYLGWDSLGRPEAVSFEELYKENDQLKWQVARLEVALAESFEEEMYSAHHCGIVQDRNVFWTGGMSEAEWLLRKIGLKGPKCENSKVLELIPPTAKQMAKNVKDNVS